MFGNDQIEFNKETVKVNFIDWSLKVDVLFEISDNELDILLKLSANSEKSKVLEAVQTDGFIYNWKQLSDMRHLSRDGKIFFSASIPQLSVVTELLEADYTAESAKLHLEFQEMLSNALLEQERLSPRVMEE